MWLYCLIFFAYHVPSYRFLIIDGFIDILYPSISAGASGAITGVPNFAPVCAWFIQYSPPPHSPHSHLYSTYAWSSGSFASLPNQIPPLQSRRKLRIFKRLCRELIGLRRELGYVIHCCFIHSFLSWLNDISVFLDFRHEVSAQYPFWIWPSPEASSCTSVKWQGDTNKSGGD